MDLRCKMTRKKMLKKAIRAIEKSTRTIANATELIEALLLQNEQSATDLELCRQMQPVQQQAAILANGETEGTQ